VLVLLTINFIFFSSAKKWVEVILRTTILPALRTICTGGLAPVKGYDQFYSYVFMTILLANVIGIIPYAITISSFTAFTFFLRFTMFIGLNIIAIAIHHFVLIGSFLPGGAPIAIAPFIVVIEMISYLVRPFSLGIRLFANMLRGHCLTKILAGFV